MWSGQSLGRLDKRANRNAVELHFGRRFNTGEVDERRNDVDVSRDGLDLVFLIETAAGPVKEEGEVVATVVFAAFGAAHAAVKGSATSGRAVVSGEDEDRVFGEILFIEPLTQASDVIVDIGDHAEEVGRGNAKVGVGSLAFFRSVVRAVRRVGEM